MNRMTAPTLLDLIAEPRVAALAWSASPAWLWTANGARLLFVNAAGAALLGETRPAALTEQNDDRLRAAASEISKIAGGLPMSGTGQLARLRALSGGLGRALMCLCARYRVADGTPAVLIIAQEPVKPALTLAERTRRLIDDADAAVFAADGTLVHAGAGAAGALAGRTSLSALDAGAIAASALANGAAEDAGLHLRRIGAGDHVMLLAHFMPAAPVARRAARCRRTACHRRAARGTFGSRRRPAPYRRRPRRGRDRDPHRRSRNLRARRKPPRARKARTRLARRNRGRARWTAAGCSGAEGRPPQEKQEASTVDAVTSAALDEELSDDELRELAAALEPAAEATNVVRIPETERQSAEERVSALDDEFTDEELRDLEEALGGAR